MKYMGSKRVMLANGLGHLIDREITKAKRFVDLFAGSSAVTRHAACRHDVSVLAFDLQHFSKVLAGAVVDRDRPLDADTIWLTWNKRAQARFSKFSNIPTNDAINSKSVATFRSWSAQQSGVITRAYGGHYFSPTQASWVDSFLETLPAKSLEKNVALAALIDAASQSAAAPGHTAQPFQPTRGATRFLQTSWKVELPSKVMVSLKALASIHAKRIGVSKVADANKAAKQLQEGDLVFVDPPYSGVHYSRFYHVLETIARMKCGEVSGVGRYPPPSERPRSSYSMKGKAADALDDLLGTIADRGGKAIVTFPDHECSNGLSGETIVDMSAEYFRINVREVDSKFSTLGGKVLPIGKAGRGGRQDRSELVLVLEPR
jgi:adenine-specific DNA-methyltransferase